MWMSISLLLAPLAFAEEPECADVDSLLLKATTDVNNMEVRDAKERLLEVMDATKCSPRLTPRQVSEYFQLKGTVYDLEEKPEASNEAFAAAKRIGPDALRSDLSQRAQELFASASTPTGLDIEVRFKGKLDDDDWLNVDGVLTSKDDVWVPLGLHLVQVGKKNARDSVEFDAQAGTVPRLPLYSANQDISNLERTVDYSKARRTPKERKKDRLVAGALAAGAGGLLYGSAVGVYEGVYQRGNPPFTDGARNAVNGLTLGAAGAGLVSATLLTWGAATPVTAAN